MSLSLKVALDTIRENGGSLDFNDLGFVLTVLRDNSLNIEVYGFLHEVIRMLVSKKGGFYQNV